MMKSDHGEPKVQNVGAARTVRLSVVALILCLLATLWHQRHVSQLTDAAEDSIKRRREVQHLIGEIVGLSGAGDEERIVAPQGFLAFPHIREVAEASHFDATMNFESIGSQRLGESTTVQFDIDILVPQPVALDELTRFLLQLAQTEVPMRCVRIELSEPSSGGRTRASEDQPDEWRVERLIVRYLGTETGTARIARQ